MRAPLLVTGGSGQLATALHQAATSARLPVRRVGRPAFDFDRPDSIAHCFRDTAPSAVINAAAYTAVDAAENDAEATFRTNRDGPAMLAELCEEARIPLIHVSTDYVFDGRKGEPYVETDPTNPQGVYGAAKLAGEQAVLAVYPRALVLRTSWVYAPEGKNFVRTMLNAARRTDRLHVVADQKGCPTTAADLANAILAMLARIREEGCREDQAGIYHAAGSGWTTWHGLAIAAFEDAARYGLRAPAVEPIATADWPTPAARPADSRLDCGKLAARFGIRLPPWRESLTRTVDAIFSASADAPRSPARV
jgi:dTDP-4-dehydrorhamnose reductase